MKIKTIAFLSLLALFFACGNNDEDASLGQVDNGLLTLLDDIPADKYYPTDDLSSEVDINGIWSVDRTSGGFSGGGYEQDFDHLLVKPNGIFGLEKDNELVASGKIQRISRPDGFIYVQFEPDFNPNPLSYQLLIDNIKLIELRNDSLELRSDCCDRYNTHLIKMD